MKEYLKSRFGTMNEKSSFFLMKDFKFFLPQRILSSIKKKKMVSKVRGSKLV